MGNIFFGFYKTRHVLLSNSANCTVGWHPHVQDSSLCSDVPLFERHSSALPRREHLSGSRYTDNGTERRIERSWRTVVKEQESVRWTSHHWRMRSRQTMRTRPFVGNAVRNLHLTTSLNVPPVRRWATDHFLSPHHGFGTVFHQSSDPHLLSFLFDENWKHSCTTLASSSSDFSVHCTVFRYPSWLCKVPLRR